jgi:hypothetical protein
VTAEFSFAQKEDIFEKVKRLVYQGEYESAINILNGYITDLQAIKKEKQNLAMAYYQLARIYYRVGETDEKIDANLKLAFGSYPLLKVDEPDLAFKDRAEKIKKELEDEGIIKMPDEISTETRQETVKDVIQKKEPEKESKIIEKPKKKKKKKKFPYLMVIGGAAAVVVLVILLTKKKKKYTLTVNRSEGVEGSPTAGTYTHKKGETVSYNFSRSSGYTDLIVTLDGNPVSSSGSIVMNADHTLSASTTKIGRVTGATVRFRVTFAGENLKVDHNIKVDGSSVFNERLLFDQHYNQNHSWADFQKIVKTFSINKGLGTFTIRHEAGPWYRWFYNESRWIGSTKYELQITNYTYTDGADPGAPSLSDTEFYLDVAPWRTNPSEAWYRIKTKEISIIAPSVSSFKRSKKISKEKPRVLSHK